MSAAGHYEILGVLGRGGFGAVYHARFHGRHSFTQDVALKVVLPGSVDEELATRLRDEARVLALVHHPNIVAVHRLSLLDQGWAVAMERVRGVDLALLVEALGPLPVGPALEIVAQVAGALYHAWTQVGPDGSPLRAIHRDIKPENLRLTSQGIVKVLDFGIAHAAFGARESKTARDLVPGTMKYMAPERFEGAQGPEGDVYALGCVLYALLAGEVLGAARDEEEIHDGWVRKRITRLADKREEVSQDVLTSLYGLLRFDPGLRPDAAALERSSRSLAREEQAYSLAEQAPAWISRIGEAPPDLSDPAVGAELRELSAPSVARSVEGGVDGETVFSPLPLPPAPGQVQIAPLVPASTDGDVVRDKAAQPRSRWERITWGHVGAFVALLALGCGAAASALLRADAPPVAEAAPVPVVEAPAEIVAPVEPNPVAAAPTTDSVLVRVAGDAEQVELVRGAKRVRLPARVAPGDWSLSVRFPGVGGDRDKGTVNVRAGLQIRCEGEFMTCAW